MALSLDAAATLAASPAWIGKIKVATHRAATQIATQILATNPPYSNRQRAMVVKCRQVLQNIDDYGPSLALMLAADTVLDQTNGTDADIVARIIALWPNISEIGFGTD